jgi:hypothetical protein
MWDLVGRREGGHESKRGAIGDGRWKREDGMEIKRVTEAVNRIKVHAICMCRNVIMKPLALSN